MRLDTVDREWMLRGAIGWMKQTRKLKVELWSIVGDICCVGSTSAHEICRELGWNPNAKATDDLPKRRRSL